MLGKNLQRVSKIWSWLSTGGRALRVNCWAGVSIDLPLEAHRHFWRGLSPDADLLQFLSGHLADGATFIDIGANVGIYSAALSAAKRKRIRCVAFEPIPSTVEVLERTFALNGLENYEIAPIALSSRAGKLRLSNFGGGANNFWLRTANTRVPTLEVATRTLDEWVASRSTGLPAAIKIDVEGHELEVLKGAAGTIRRAQPAMVVECHCAAWEELSVSRGEFHDLVQSFGYRHVRERLGRPLDLATTRETIHLLFSA